MPPRPKKSNTEEDDLDSPVTYRGLESALNKHLNKTIEALQSSLEATTKIANDALTQVSKLEKEVAVLKEEIVKLKTSDKPVTRNVWMRGSRIELIGSCERPWSFITSRKSNQRRGIKRKSLWLRPSPTFVT